MQIKSIFGPRINDTRLDDKYSFDDNFFVTANAGFGYYTLALETNNPFVTDDVSTDVGFSFNIRTGKEWMVSRKWGLGAVLFFRRMSLKTKEETFTEKWYSNRFGIYFQATHSRIK